MGTLNEPVQVAGRDTASSHTGPLRITFVVTGLGTGGAEMMLWKLVSRIDRTRFEPAIVVLSGTATAMLPAFRELGIECHVLGWRTGRSMAGGVFRLREVLRQRNPDVVQGWMYHGNITATIAAALGRLSAPILWNVRGTLMDRRIEKRLTLFVIWLCGKLSFVPAAIINNSVTSALEHEQRMGFAPAKRVVLPNGFDTDAFRPSDERRKALRGELGLRDGEVVIGLVARYHPMKRHDVFLRAAAAIARTHPHARFVLVGDGVDTANPELARRAAEPALERRVHLMGPRTDIAAITAGFDIAVSSSSSGEGFPNVIGEAMSCGVPCVATDVGDSRMVVGDTGVTVAPGDATALAAGIAALIELGDAGRAALGMRARARAIEKFSLNAVVRQYEELYTKIHREYRSA